MENRVFTGGALAGISNLSAGVLEVTPLERTPTAGGQVLSTATITYTITNGQIVGSPARIPSPMVARFVLRSTASAAARRIPILNFIGTVPESEDPITLGDIYAGMGPIEVDQLAVRVGDDLTLLTGTGDAGDVPTLQADGSIVFEAPTGGGGGSGDVTGPGISVDARIATWNGTGGDTLADGGATIAQVRDRSTHTGEQAISTVTGLQTALDAKATPAQITTAIDNLIAAAPGALDTLDELAAALGDDANYAATVTTALAGKATTTALSDEATARIAGDATVRAIVDSLLPVYDLDNMPSAYAGANTTPAKLQWIVGRLYLSDDGLTAVDRDIMVWVGDGDYDLTLAAYQQEGTISETWVHGATLYGACTQILLPNAGSLATHNVRTIVWKYKKWAIADYSVVNGDGLNEHELATGGVIYSDAVPPSGEGGNYSMIGADREGDAYANTRIAPINMRFEGVLFRCSGGLTPFDASHCFSVEGSQYRFDTGVAAHLIHNSDPRRDAAGGAFVDGDTEIDYRKRQFGLKTPMLWNGARSYIAQIEGMGTCYGIDLNEHIVIGNLFLNYCRRAVGLRGMSHPAQIMHASFQRCSIWWEAPQASDWNGNATYSIVKVGLSGGEAYHPGEFGNPAGDRWYNHVARVWDPDSLIRGEINLYVSTAEQPPTWTTITDGHGENLVLNLVGDLSSVQVDTTPAMQTVTPVAGVATFSDGQEPTETWAEYEAKIDAATTIAFGSLAHGSKLRITLKHSGVFAASWAAAPSGYTLLTSGTFDATPVDDQVEFVEAECCWTNNPTKKIIRARVLPETGTVTGVTVEAGATLIIHDTFAAALNTALHNNPPDTLNNDGGNWTFGGTGSLLTDGSGSVYNNGGPGATSLVQKDFGTTLMRSEIIANLPDDTEDHVLRAIVNYVDASNYWYVNFINFTSGGLIQLRSLIAGTDTNESGNITVSGGLGTTDTLALEVDVVDNTKLYVKVNGVTVHTQTFASRAHRTSTRGGFGFGYAGSPKASDFNGYSMA